MGVTYTHSAGYGIVVDRDFITDELLRTIEYHPDYGELEVHYRAQDWDQPRTISWWGPVNMDCQYITHIRVGGAGLT